MDELLLEIPDELTPRRLPRVALPVFGEDRDPRTEERHLILDAPQKPLKNPWASAALHSE
jgi:hypothetical protein